MRRLAPVIALLMVLLAAACSKGWNGDDPEAGPEKTGGETSRTAEAGGIEVRASWLTEADGKEDELEAYPSDRFVLIEVAFTTHSGDLNSIRIEEAARLRQAGSLLAPESWVSTSDDSHHRAGILVFPRELGDGAVELVLDLGDEEVAMRWESMPGT